MISWLTKDWSTKLLALVLAIGLWYYAVGEEKVQITRSVPLKIELQNATLSVLHVSSENLQVTLAGERNLLNQMTSDEVVAVHKIGSEVEKAGEYSFRIEAREIRLPKPQIQVVDIKPEVVQITLDEVIVEKLKVKPNFVGEPAFGYKIKTSEIQLNPNEILIKGPKDEIRKLEFVSTGPIDLVGRIRGFRQMSWVELPEKLQALSDPRIEVQVPIQEEYEEMKFADIAFKVLASTETNYWYEVKPPKVSFAVRGSKRHLEKLTPESLLAYVDLSKLSPGEHDLPVTVVLPEDVSIQDKTPTVHAVIRKK